MWEGKKPNNLLVSLINQNSSYDAYIPPFVNSWSKLCAWYLNLTWSQALPNSPSKQDFSMVNYVFHLSLPYLLVIITLGSFQAWALILSTTQLKTSIITTKIHFLLCHLSVMSTFEPTTCLLPSYNTTCKC